jgi:hypothetical protein
MTFLARLAADPKSLTARMRVGQVEPVALRRAVAALDMREGSEGPSTDPDVAELQQRIASLVSEDALDGLSRRGRVPRRGVGARARHDDRRRDRAGRHPGTAGSETRSSSPSGAMVSSVM